MVNLRDLAQLPEGAVVEPETLKKAGLIRQVVAAGQDSGHRRRRRAPSKIRACKLSRGGREENYRSGRQGGRSLMLDRFTNIFKIPELRDRILFTLLIFLVYRIGGHVPVAGINAGALAEFFQQNANTLFGLYDMFVGGAFQRATIFALGIMPYISASIIFQLMGTVVPYFQKLQKEGEEGRKKINQLTRYGTVIIAALQAGGVSDLPRAARRLVGRPGGAASRLRLPLPDDGHADRRHDAHHVAGRADHRARHRQRHLAAHLHRHH